MDVLRTCVSLLGALDPDASIDTPQVHEKLAIRLISRVATMVAAIGRTRQGEPVIPPRRSGSHAANFLRMLTGKEPDEFSQRAMDVALILHADHEFNASTFSARVTISTLSDVYSAVTSAIGTLKGPLHGGANLGVMRQLEAIGSVDRVQAWVSETLAKHEKIMGFGHAVYKIMDPRAVVLKKISLEAGKRAGDTKWYELSAKLEDAVFRQKGLYPNVDFYSASTYRSLGIPMDLYPSIFAVSRISGWCAHILEQLGHNKLIRPMSNYIGPQLRPYPTKRVR
jgi:citrate synthase